MKTHFYTFLFLGLTTTLSFAQHGRRAPGGVEQILRDTAPAVSRRCLADVNAAARNATADLATLQTNINFCRQNYRELEAITQRAFGQNRGGELLRLMTEWEVLRERARNLSSAEEPIDEQRRLFRSAQVLETNVASAFRQIESQLGFRNGGASLQTPEGFVQGRPTCGESRNAKSWLSTQSTCSHDFIVSRARRFGASQILEISTVSYNLDTSNLLRHDTGNVCRFQPISEQQRINAFAQVIALRGECPQQAENMLRRERIPFEDGSVIAPSEAPRDGTPAL